MIESQYGGVSIVSNAFTGDSMLAVINEKGKILIGMDLELKDCEAISKVFAQCVCEDNVETSVTTILENTENNDKDVTTFTLKVVRKNQENTIDIEWMFNIKDELGLEVTYNVHKADLDVTCVWLLLRNLSPIYFPLVAKSDEMDEAEYNKILRRADNHIFIASDEPICTVNTAQLDLSKLVGGLEHCEHSATL